MTLGYFSDPRIITTLPYDSGSVDAVAWTADGGPDPGQEHNRWWKYVATFTGNITLQASSTPDDLTPYIIRYDTSNQYIDYIADWNGVFTSPAVGVLPVVEGTEYRILVCAGGGSELDLTAYNFSIVEGGTLPLYTYGSSILAIHMSAAPSITLPPAGPIAGSTSLAFNLSASFALLLHGAVNLDLVATTLGELRIPFSSLSVTPTHGVPIYTVTARLYQPDGATFVTVLPLARKIQFQIENSKPGTASFELPLHDPDNRTKLVTDDMIVKFSWMGQERFGIVVKTANCQLTADDETWITFNSQPGIMALLERAVVMPEYSLKPADVSIPERYPMPKNAGTQRLFGYMSKWGGWAIRSDWVKPLGEAWNAAGKSRGPNPTIFQVLDKNVMWIAAPPGPSIGVPEGTIQYFRSEFTVGGTVPQKYQIYMSGDNFATVYVDGELVIEPDLKKPLSWLTVAKADLELAPGVHLIAADVKNGGVAVAPPLLIAKVNVTATVVANSTMLINIANPLLGVTLAEGDRVLLTKQTDSGRNGTYVFYKAITGAHPRPNRLVKSSSANPLGLIGDLTYMKKVTGQPASNIVKEVIAGDVQFDQGEYNLDSGDKKALRALALKVAIITAPVIVIEGHASSEGDTDDNMILSQHRASAVWQYLKTELRKRTGWQTSYETQSVVPGGLITVRGYGEERLQYTPGTNPKNRRVEIAYPVLEPGVNAGDVMKPIVVRRTDITNWIAHDGTPTPGWFRASVIKKLVEEAKLHGVSGMAGFKIGFNDIGGNDYLPWQNRGQFSFALVTTNLLDVALQLTEEDLDLGFDAATMELRGWQRRGRDLTTGDRSVRLSVGDGLKSYETTRTAPRATVVIGRYADGSWFEVRDEEAYAKYGRRVMGLSMSSAQDEKTAQKVARTLLKENSNPVVVVTAETSTFQGPQPFRDWDIGDTVMVPGHKGIGVMPARALSITVDATGDAVRIWSEFVVDSSSPSYEDIG